MEGYRAQNERDEAYAREAQRAERAESERDQLASGYAIQLTKRKDAERQLRGAVALDDDTLADLDKRAAIHGTDRAAYLRWVLTGATNATSPRIQASTEDHDG